MFAPLKHRGFRDLWLGQAISQFGDALYFIVFMFVASEIAGAGFVGWVAAAETLPFLLLGPYAGVLADRLDRRVLLLASDLVSAIILIVCAVLTLPAIGVHGSGLKAMLLVVPFGLSCVRCFFFPARGAAIPTLVPESDVVAANSLSTFTMTVAQIGGLALSAAVISPIYTAHKGIFLSLICGLNAISFLASAVFIARLPKLLPDRDAEPPHVLEDLREGLGFVRQRLDLMLTILVIASLRFFVAPFFVCFTAANKQWFGGKPHTLAWFEFTFFLGMFVTTPFVTKLKVSRPLVAMTLAFAVAGLTIAGFAYTRDILVFCALNFVAGLVIPLGDIPVNAYLQLSVVDAFRGRVQSVLNMLGTGVMPLGAVIGGKLVEGVGLPTTFLIMGLGVTIPSLLALFAGPYRDARMPAEAIAMGTKSP